MNDVELLRDALAHAARSLGAPSDVAPLVERPRDPSFGDWTTNLALTLAKPLGKKPRDIATALIAALDLSALHVAAAEIAGAGFINFRMQQAAFARGLAAIIAKGDGYGKSDVGHGQRVMVEFVSANPTGPLHVGHGRQAALGDAISRLLEWTGWDVSREFYYNDAGNQIDNLTASVQALIRGQSVPEKGYHGEYIKEIAAQYTAAYPDSDNPDQVRQFAVRVLRAEQDRDLQAFGVYFDTYYLESSLYTDGSVEKTVARLRESGYAYQEDGALKLRTTAFGDDLDRVIIKRDGTYTYVVPDIAYHVGKWQRGFRRVINIHGADHVGYWARVRAGLQMMGEGIPDGWPEYVIHDLVKVSRAGEEVRMSKRAGSYVTLQDLLEWVGRDAVRYFFLMRRYVSDLTFDVDLAQRQSDENPVYYVQMAHARMCGIFRVGGINKDELRVETEALDALTTPEELELIKALLDFPDIVESAAQGLEPQRITAYLHEMAQLAHHWYHKYHVLGEPEPVQSARLALARATQLVLRNAMTLLGIHAPERM
ncbi:MAG TPA: arginine--tRNA ligase [Gemmatimonadaceae bacterium]|nr:arginine--tRNA ligase [Gemmatimonadaceae bacterium]